MYAIGIDIGTTSVSGILHGVADGKVVRSLTVPNDTFIKSPFPWAKLQDANRLLEIAKGVLTELLSGGEKVVSIGVTGQMHGIVYLDRKGEPISDLCIWQDGRGDLFYKDDKSYSAFMTEETGYNVATGYGSVTYFYDNENGFVPENADVFCTIHDLFAMRLAGLKRPVTHPSDAASLGLFDLKSGRFDADAIQKLGLKVYMFPDVCRENTVLGHYNGIPISVAIGDNQASFLGSVSDIKNSILINVGTGSQVSCYTDTVPDSTAVDCRPLVDGGFILAGSSLCGGRAYAILERFFREIAEGVTGVKVDSAYQMMDALTDGGSVSELTVNTQFGGTRENPELRGSICNINTENLTAKALCDGFMNGMAKELFDMFNAMKPHLNSLPKVAVGSGNGIRNNKALSRVLERVFGITLMIPKTQEEAAFGASLFALVSARVIRDLETAGKLIKYEE